MIRFLIIGSGSKGNATLVYDEDTVFLIDMGVPFSRLEAGAASIGRQIKDLKAVLVTHSHIDHVGTLGLLPPGLPIYATAPDLAELANPLVPEEAFGLGSFFVIPFLLSHDAPGTCGFVIAHEGEKLVYATDTGMIPEQDFSYMRGGTYYIIESNHDALMLLRSKRPLALKRRIRSDLGHLSNADSAEYMADFVTDETKGIFLAHLSEECNTPAAALRTYARVFRRKGLDPERYGIRCARQWEPMSGGDPCE